MKKVFIGLLILAAGAGGYYFLQKKKTETDTVLKKELLTGKWKLDSLYFSSKDSSSVRVTGHILHKDSSFKHYQYDFQKGGTFLQTLSDPVKADTSYYEWSKKNELLIRESIKDSIGEIYSVNRLNLDSLVLHSKDSTVLVFTKLK